MFSSFDFLYLNGETILLDFIVVVNQSIELCILAFLRKRPKREDIFIEATLVWTLLSIRELEVLYLSSG